MGEGPTETQQWSWLEWCQNGISLGFGSEATLRFRIRTRVTVRFRIRFRVTVSRRIGVRVTVRIRTQITIPVKNTVSEAKYVTLRLCLSLSILATLFDVSYVFKRTLRDFLGTYLQILIPSSHDPTKP